METIQKTALVFNIIGALNWALVGLFDLNGYGEGEHQVKVTVEGDDPKVQFFSNKQITIVISAK